METNAIALVEVALRAIIRDVLGNDWITAKGAPLQSKLEKEQAREASKRTGRRVNDDLLEYTDLVDLRDLIEENWDHFEPVFGDKDQTRALLEIVRKYRNAVAHSRSLLEFERNLLAGSTEHLRNQVALYRSSRNDAAAYYATIERVTDNWGNAGDPFLWAADAKRSMRIDVGQELVFECLGADPILRDIEWSMKVSQGGMKEYSRWEPLAIGENVTLRRAVTAADVGEQLVVVIYMRNSSEYHRASQRDLFNPPHDEMACFYYAVNPPVRS